MNKLLKHLQFQANTFKYICDWFNYFIAENIGEFSYIFRLHLEVKNLANGLILANGFRKFEGENIGDLLTIRQCFLLYST